MLSNAQRLNAAVVIALADLKFMGDNTKVDKAIEGLTPKSTVSAVLKRLQGNARRDFLDKKDEGLAGYTELDRGDRIREYVKGKFQSHMDAPKTSVEATKLFNAVYPVVTSPISDSLSADGIADKEEKAS